MPGPGPDVNGLYLHPDGTMRRERYDGPLNRWPENADWTFWDQVRVMFGGEPTAANRLSAATNGMKAGRLSPNAARRIVNLEEMG